jgi:hypothetical protein
VVAWAKVLFFGFHLGPQIKSAVAAKTLPPPVRRVTPLCPSTGPRRSNRCKFGVLHHVCSWPASLFPPGVNAKKACRHHQSERNRPLTYGRIWVKYLSE